MKKSILTILAIVALYGNVIFANAPSQDKPVSKTTTTVKKTMPGKAAAKATAKTSKSVHKKHVKNS